MKQIIASGGAQCESGISWIPIDSNRQKPTGFEFVWRHSPCPNDCNTNMDGDKGLVNFHLGSLVPIRQQGKIDFSTNEQLSHPNI